MSAGDDLVLWSGDAADAVQWTANAADGSRAALSFEPGAPAALRFDFTLAGHGAWVIARRELTATLPAHYVAVLTLRGAGDPLELQLKLVDPSGQNVWWWRRPGFAPPPAVERVTLRKLALEFAWGPVSGGEPRQIGAVELGLAGAGSGTLWIESLRLEARDPAAAQARVVAVRASSAASSHAAELVRAADEATSWSCDPADARPWIELDLGRVCEFGGVVADFAGPAPACRLLASDDGEHWRPLAETPGGARRCWLRTADGEGRFARLELAADSPAAIIHADVVPLAQAVSPARYLTATALAAPRGRYPRHLLGEQAYWALIGTEGDERKGLLSEDGALEVDAESFTLEPFVWGGGQLLSWADVETHRSLAENHLPIPTVEWQAADLRLRITAVAAGPPGRSTLVARYALVNDSAVLRKLRLFVAIRPFQVNPAWQSLNLVGGVAPITQLACEAARVRVNAAHSVLAVTRPDAVGAAPSETGLAALAGGDVPTLTQVDDPLGSAEAVFAFDLELAAGETGTVAVAVPLFEASPPPPAGLDRAAAAAWADERIAEVSAHWQARFAALPIELPAGAARFIDTLRASIAWIMINREGPRIQPGPRCYRRSWIRDGTLTGTALAEMGFADELRAFLRWYAPFQLADGRVPCAVDRRGIDLAVEHDSHGQLVWGVVETFRLTGDTAFLRELWPHALRAVDAIAALRTQRTGEDLRGDARYGLLPESISHEGYASHPVHSYWDDFFAVRALADAAEAASLLGDAAAERIGALRDAMRGDLQASIARSIAQHGIDFIPGSAELGDFDPTSTAIALDPCAAAALLPPAALARTFDRYWAELDARRRGAAPNDAYAPYEVRTAAALVMLGQKQRAVELLEWLMADQRPTEWCEWPEVVWRDRRAPRFFGDLPHGWVASSYLRAVRRLLAYEELDDAALVLAAGVPEAWVREAPGVRVHGLPTHLGRLDFSMCAEADDRVRVTIGGGLRWPRDGVIVTSPLDRALREIVIDGRAERAPDPRHVVLRARATDLLLCY